MELKAWTPFLDLDRSFRLFDFPPFTREMTGFEFRPSIDVIREGEELVVTAELPGMAAEDIDVTLDKGVLTIKGEKTHEEEISEDDRYVRERSFGRFQRRITLPEGVKADAMNASYDKGILSVRVALPEEKTQTPRQIPVEAHT